MGSAHFATWTRLSHSLAPQSQVIASAPAGRGQAACGAGDPADPRNNAWILPFQSRDRIALFNKMEELGYRLVTSHVDAKGFTGPVPQAGATYYTFHL